MFGFGQKKEVRIGQGFVHGIPIQGSTKQAIKDALKGQIIQYGKALKSTYLTPLQKKDMKIEMAKLDKKLKELDKEKKYYAKKEKVRSIKSDINKLKHGTSNLKKADNWVSRFGEVPDVIGAKNFGNIGHTKLNLPGGGSSHTKLNLPGGKNSGGVKLNLPGGTDKIKRYW